MALLVNELARLKIVNIIKHESILLSMHEGITCIIINHQVILEPQIGVGLHPESAMRNFTTQNEINDEGKRAQA